MNTLLKVDTPCVGICSTVYGDATCRGCKRTASSQEIIDWNGYNEEVKKTILLRLETLQIQIVQKKITIVSVTKLQDYLTQHSVRYRIEADPLCWVYHLLRVRAHKITDLSSCGIDIKSIYSHYTLPKLFSLINSEFLCAATI